MARSFSIGLAILGSALIALGCAPKPPTVRTGADAELSFDGLQRVDHAGFAGVWVKPGAKLARYTKVLLMRANFHYRAVEAAGRRSSEFEVPENRRDQFERIVGEAFGKELAKSKYYQITQEPGPDVLLLVGALHDVVSHVPPERGERGDTFVSEIGEATLVLELRDSESNEVLARVAERRTVRPTRELAMSSSVTTASEVRKTASRWGATLRRQLDALHDL
jgi:hypothetical protein